MRTLARCPLFVTAHFLTPTPERRQAVFSTTPQARDERTPGNDERSPQLPTTRRAPHQRWAVGGAVRGDSPTRDPGRDAPATSRRTRRYIEMARARLAHARASRVSRTHDTLWGCCRTRSSTAIELASARSRTSRQYRAASLSASRPVSRRVGRPVLAHAARCAPVDTTQPARLDRGRSSAPACPSG
jgi:hypothetical protein